MSKPTKKPNAQADEPAHEPGKKENAPVDPTASLSEETINELIKQYEEALLWLEDK